MMSLVTTSGGHMRELSAQSVETMIVLLFPAVSPKINAHNHQENVCR